MEQWSLGCRQGCESGFGAQSYIWIAAGAADMGIEFEVGNVSVT